MKTFQSLPVKDLQKLVINSQSKRNVIGALIELRKRNQMTLKEDYLQNLVYKYGLNNIDALFENAQNYIYIEDNSLNIEEKIEKKYIPIFEYLGIGGTVLFSIGLFVNNPNIFAPIVLFIGIFITLFISNLFRLLTTMTRLLRNLNKGNE
jgi:hypothetical protein